MRFGIQEIQIRSLARETNLNLPSLRECKVLHICTCSMGLVGKKESRRAFRIRSWKIVVSFLFFFKTPWFIHSVLLVARQGDVTARKDCLEFLQKNN